MTKYLQHLRMGLFLLAVMFPAALASAVQLTYDGESQMPIVLGPALSDTPIHVAVDRGYGQADIKEASSSALIRTAAQTLADYLQQISGASFEIVTGDGKSGIAIGLFSDFPDLDFEDHFDGDDLFRTEEYIIRSHAKGLQLIGASEQAVQHAVWDLLYRLGYRQFFPNENWEIVPENPNLAIDIDVFESPDFHSRLIWYGKGYLDYNKQPYADWTSRNRAVAGFLLNTSHEYNSIRKRNKKAFAENPAFYAMVDGERKASNDAKFNIANSELRELVLQDAIRWFEDHPHQVSKSMDPSDMGGWSESPESQAIGTPTDQALTLANHVAQGVNDFFNGDRYVGMYAYYQHQSPPNIRVHPNVIISFATRFLREEMTVEELMKKWRKQGSERVGIREYYSVSQWDWDIPALSTQGGDIGYLQYSIPHFYDLGARFLTSESSDNWGPNGLGYYLASRMLWDVDEAERIDELVDDFLEKAFGPAREPMAEFYELLNGVKRPLLRDNPMGRLYTLLQEATALVPTDSDVRARLNDLILYVHYLELFHDYTLAQGAARQQAFESLIRYAYRMRRTSMVHTKPLYQRNMLAARDPQVEIPDEAAWKISEEKNPWKDSTPFSQAEVDTMLDNGVKRFMSPEHTLPVLRVQRNAAKVNDTSVSPRIRYMPTFLVDGKAGQQVSFTVYAQFLDKSYPPRFLVVSPSGQIVAEGETTLRAGKKVCFRAPETGVYRVEIGSTPNTVQFESSHPWALLARDQLGVLGRISLKRPATRLYFQVPAGVKEVGIQVSGQGDGEKVDATLQNADGNVVASASAITGKAPVRLTATRANDQEAEIWSIALDQSEGAYFGDVSLDLDDSLPPVLATHPNYVFQADK